MILLLTVLVATVFLPYEVDGCRVFNYWRGAGRIPNKAPCGPGLRDDGVSCWRDAHIFGKGCCCTVFGCCHKCPPGYHDDPCTCRKTNVGIVTTLQARYYCNPGEELYGALCYPKCEAGFRTRGCCICECASSG